MLHTPWRKKTYCIRCDIKFFDIEWKSICFLSRNSVFLIFLKKYDYHYQYSVPFVGGKKKKKRRLCKNEMRSFVFIWMYCNMTSLQSINAERTKYFWSFVIFYNEMEENDWCFKGKKSKNKSTNENKYIAKE